MVRYRIAVFACAALLATLLVGLHAPGQLSVDSGVALYEGMVGSAIGWGPPFFAALLDWLGGGVLGASVFVSLNTVAIYGCFAVLLTAGLAPKGISWWRYACAVILVLNPLFAFYAGILWKDVALATCAMVAITALLVSTSSAGKQRCLLLCVALIAIAPMPLLRQQGVMLAAPLAAAAAWIAGSAFDARGARRLGIVAAILGLSAMSTLALSRLSEATIRPLPASPVSVGIEAIVAYDIVGMIAYALPTDTSEWSGADAATRQQIKYLYSPERIDTLWHDPLVRTYVSGLGESPLRQAWWHGLRHDPIGYASHRVAALRALMGLGPVDGCVPAYWGVAIPPDYVEALGVREEMDPRDRFIGRTSIALYPSPVFRHWWYAGLLVLASIAAIRRRAADALVLRVVAGIAWVYLASYAVTTIACDFRYLYPVACMATMLCVWRVLRPVPRV